MRIKRQAKFRKNFPLSTHDVDTVNQLIEKRYEIHGICVIMVLIVYQKAFDRVSHSRMLKSFVITHKWRGQDRTEHLQ